VNSRERWFGSVRWELLKNHAGGRGLNIGAGTQPIPLPIETLDARAGFKGDFNCSCDAIPVKDGAYDYALASHVLEHLANPVKALREWSRVVRKDGKLIVFMPDCRLYPDDRRRLNEAGPSALAESGALLERYRRGVANDEYDVHHDVWSLDAAVGLFERLGFSLLETREATPAALEAFERELLDGETRGDQELFDESLELQRRLGLPATDYSFMLVAANPGLAAVERALA
jgi:SAM-dependent methyltransferase